VVSPAAYATSVAIGVAVCVLLCAAARRRRGRATAWAGRLLGVVLAAVVVSWTVASVRQGSWTLAGSLPLALCDVAVIVAAVACWWPHPLLVELTWFWGLAGTLQAVITPDLGVPFPHLVFFQYVIGHLGIVIAALYLVVGLGLRPRAGAVARTFAITVAYTGLVGAVDGVTGGNYMYLRTPPQAWTLLRVLGPWPWYTVSAAGVAVVLLLALDLPFRVRRGEEARRRGLNRSAARMVHPGDRLPLPG